MQPEQLFNCMKKYIKKEWVICFFSAVFFGLAAHLFKITNFIPNWDSLLNLYNDQNKTNLGRCFLGFACSFSTYYDLPWINGFLSLIYVGLSAVCVSELFEIKSRISLVLIGGLMATFPTVTSTLAYNYTADGYFLALLSICLAVIVCVRFHRGLLPAAVLIAFGLGIYQAYITFAMVLMLIYLVDELLFKQINMKQFWTMSCRFAVCGVLGGIGYWMSMKITVFISGIQLSEYQNIDKSFSLQEMNFFSSVLRAGYKFLKYFFDFSSGINLFLIINIILFSGLSILFLYSFWAQKTYRQFWRIFLTGMCLIAIPFASYALYFVNPILDYHNLMVMCLCLIYILPVLFYERLSELSDRMFIIKQWGILGLSALTIFNFILIANISYQKLYMSYGKSYGVIIRLADRIEQLPGALECNKLAVIGCLPGSESISVDFPPDMTGITDDYIIRKQDTMMQENVTQAMLQDYCGITFEDTTEDDIRAVCKKEEFSQMNEWPEQNSVSIIGDILVVNFGGEKDE